MITYIQSNSVVISHKWIKHSKLIPSYAQFLIGTFLKTTNVSTNHGHTEQLEIQNT